MTQNGILLLAPTIFEFGTPTQQAHILPRMAAGEDLWCQGWSEPDAGSDLASPAAGRGGSRAAGASTARRLMAFNQKDGAVVWRKHDFKNSTSSPILINVDGQDQIVAFMFGEIVGVEPNSGALLWSHPHPTEYGLNTSTPVWGEDNLLFVSSAYGGGSRAQAHSRRRQNNGRAGLGAWLDARAFRQLRSRRRFGLRVERRFRPRAVHGRQRQDRQGRMA